MVAERTAERLSGANLGGQLAERVTGNVKILPTLLAGGSQKELALQRVISELGNDPAVQACFLTTLFGNIAREGSLEMTDKETLEVTDRRDASVAILTDTTDGKVHLPRPIAPLIQVNQRIVGEAYISGVQRQTKENDPLSGSVAALLEVGQAIAPHLIRGQQQRIMAVWEEIATQFPKENEQHHVRTKLEEIKQAMSIAKPVKTFNSTTSERKPVKRGRRPSPAIIELDSKVEELRKKEEGRLTISQIAERLGVEESAVKNSISRLTLAGKILPKKRRKTPEELAAFDAQVKALQAKGLTRRQIAENLGPSASKDQVRASLDRIRRQAHGMTALIVSKN